MATRDGRKSSGQRANMPRGGAQGGGSLVKSLGRSPRQPRLVKSIARRLAPALGAGVLLGALSAAPVSASPATLKRSIENITQAPLDLAASPYVAGQTIYQNMQNIGDTTAVRIAYPVPGYAWNVLVQGGASVLRGVTGLLELVPGIILLPFDADLEPLFDPVEDSPALVEYDNPIYRLRFGITYTSGG